MMVAHDRFPDRDLSKTKTPRTIADRVINGIINPGRVDTIDPNERVTRKRIL